MYHLSKENRDLLEATLRNLYKSANRSAELPDIRTSLSSMTDVELERSLNEFLFSRPA